MSEHAANLAAWLAPTKKRKRPPSCSESQLAARSKVIYDTVFSKAKGLGPKTGTRLTWKWKVGSSTRAGRWPVIVNCGKSGKLSLRLRVLQ